MVFIYIPEILNKDGSKFFISVGSVFFSVKLGHTFNFELFSSDILVTVVLENYLILANI